MDSSERASVEEEEQESMNAGDLHLSSNEATTWRHFRRQSWEDESDEFPWDSSFDASPHDEIIDSLPPQLHPAVSLGMRRVSSCYFSIQSGSEASNSVADLLSLLEEEQERQNSASLHVSPESLHSHCESSQSPVRLSAADVLYHDIMMHTFCFLAAADLASFSQTARRPNFECFYFLQLQLQRALLTSSLDGACSSDHDEDALDILSGVGYITRLTTLDEPAAKDIVNEYANSNSTLTRMPLSHSLAYIRHLLRNNGFQQHVTDGSHPANTLASAAFVITLVGATSVMTGSTSPEVVLPNVLKVGLAGSVLGAARDAARRSDGQSMRHTAEQMAHMMSTFPQQLRQRITTRPMAPPLQEEDDSNMMRFPSALAARMYTALTQTYDSTVDDNDSGLVAADSRTRRRGKRSRKHASGRGPSEAIGSVEDEDVPTTEMMTPMTPNPYEHLPPSPVLEQKAECPSDCMQTAEDTAESPPRKMPSGCVGAYSRAVHRAASSVTSMLKQKRKKTFLALSEDERLVLSRAFVDACTSDDGLSVVKGIVQTREGIDVDGFYVGSDGTETCALHTAAFHGACRVLEFLCKGIDESSVDDGGLCNVNLKDANGWTAMHFAAGANSVEAIKILARHGSHLAVEAANGYTPLQWAKRLSNAESVKELERLGADQVFLGEMGGWSQPLSVIANRFFALIPTR